MVLETTSSTITHESSKVLGLSNSTNKSQIMAAEATVTKVETREPVDDDSDDESQDGDFAEFMNFVKAESPVESLAAAPGPAKKVTTVKAVPVVNFEEDIGDDDSDFGDFLDVLKTDSPKTVEKKTVAAKAKATPKAKPVVAKAAPVVKKAAPTYAKALNEKAEAPKAAPKAAPVVANAAPVVMASPAKTSETDSMSDSDATRSVSVAPAKVTIAKPALTKEMSKADFAAHHAVSQIKLHDETPIGIEYFTKMAAEDQARNKVEMRELALANMAEGTKYFDKLAHEAEVKRCADIEEMIAAQRPAAVEYFTAKDMEDKEKKAAEIRALHDNPPPMSEGQAYFTNKMTAELERQRAEIQDMIDNPPPASVATEYFKIKEGERRLEIEAMMNEPAPPAIQYFTEKAREEEARNKAAMERASKGTGETSAATKHFVAAESRRKLEIEAARAVTQEKEPMEPVPVDYFSKQNSAYLVAKAQAGKDLADAEMPIGIRYFTELAEVEKAKRYEKQLALSEANMSDATRHFKAVEEEKMAASMMEQPDIMPAAIQKFTMEANAVRDAEKAEIQALHDNPPPMSEGQAYFTNKMRAELERQRAEIQAMIDNPPPASVATEYFKVKEAERQVEIEAMMNEPAPPAIQYFTQKAAEEAQRNKEAMERSMANTGETSVATKHFEQVEKQKAAEIEAARNATRSKAPMAPLPINYFTKLGNEETAAKAADRKALADSHMPEGVKFFTTQAEAEKAANAGVPQHEEAAFATKYFNNLAEEDAKRAGAEAEGDMMPAAIQKFTLEAREESMRKKAAIEELNRNPPAPAPGIVHFTPELQR